MRAATGARLVLIGWVVIAALSLVGEARADEISDRQRAEMAAAVAAEQRPDPREALARYRRALAIDDGSRLARRAKARVRWLEARSEGDFRPLTELMTMQRRAPNTTSVDDVRRFEQSALAFPEGLVRREALALVAASYRRLGEHRAALEAYRAWRRCPGVSAGERKRIELGMAQVEETLGNRDAALAQLEAADMGGHPEAVYARQQRLVAKLSPVAYLVYLIFLGLGLGWGGWRGLSRRGLRAAFTPARLGLLLWAFGVPTAMMFAYDVDVGPKFVWVAAAAAVTVALAALFGAGLRDGRANLNRRRGLAIASVLASFSACFLALARSALLFDIMLGWEVLGR